MHTEGLEHLAFAAKEQHNSESPQNALQHSRAASSCPKSLCLKPREEALSWKWVLSWIQGSCSSLSLPTFRWRKHSAMNYPCTWAP